jgi:hypothetical protein
MRVRGAGQCQGTCKPTRRLVGHRMESPAMTYTKYITGIWVSMGVALFACSLFAADSAPVANMDGTDASRALEAAVSALGFKQTRSEQASALSVGGVETLVDTTTPFVHEQLNGRRVWRVELASLRVVEQGAVSNDSLSVRDFTVFVDSASGVVLKAVARGPHYNPRLISHPSVTSAEKDLSCSFESYTGVPAIPPGVSLKEALERATIPARLSMEIIVDYLLVSYSVSSKKGEHAAWVVNMNGGFTYPLDCSRGKYERACSHYRMVVDAVTGECLMSTNIPFPPLDD